MSVSAKQLAANRANALKSTGPTTMEGKARASRNAVTHGLTATVAMVGPEAAEARAARLASCHELYAPRDEWEYWLVDELAEATLKLGRISVMEILLREVAASRAEFDIWENDRRLDAETIGTQLARHPSKVVAQLKQTPQGCEWLIERWAMLLHCATNTSGWDEPQTALAHHLLATSEPFQTTPIGIALNELAEPICPEVTPAEVAREQIALLQATRDRVAPIDEQARTRTEAGWTDLPSHDAVLLRRYEAATRRHLIWVMNQMRIAGLCDSNRTSTRASRPTAPPPEPARPVAPVAAQPASLPREVKVEQPERNEAIVRLSNNETKPISAPVLTTDAADSPRKRPDRTKLARRERKARRKRTQRQH